jgi:hypothetical protein
MLRSNVSDQVSLSSMLEEVKNRRWLWCLVAVLIVALRHFLVDGAQPLGPKFGDTDDALRLIQVREFLMAGNWFDTHLRVIGAPEALNSHWSRLIDLPVAWLISLFALFTPYLTAEACALIVWPLLLCFGMARFLVYDAERQAGPEIGMRAGLIVLVLMLVGITGLFQFKPGRIDHHNVQIACAVIGTLLLQRALTEPSAGWYAGGVLSIGLIVGFEAVPLLATIVGLAGLCACFDHQARPGVVRAVVALAAGLVLGHALSMAPADWMSADCDKLGLNLLGLVVPGAAVSGLLLLRFRHASQWLWLASLAVAGGMGIGLYVGANPVCVGGAFADLDPVVTKHWLSRVLESQSLITYFSDQPAMVISFVITMAMALAVVTHAALNTRTTTDIFVAANLALATLYGFYYIKFTPYAPLLSLVPMAVWIAKLPAMGNTPADSVRIRAVILTNQTLYVVLVTIVISIFSSITGIKATSAMKSSTSGCAYRADIAALSKLPAGLVVSDIDLGPFIAVSTPHRAYVGPYHRIHKSIRDVLMLLRSPVAEAAPHLAKMNADYLVVCGVEKGEAVKSTPAKQHKLFSDYIRNGGKIAGLEPISIGKMKGTLIVWKIVKPGS